MDYGKLLSSLIIIILLFSALSMSALIKADDKEGLADTPWPRSQQNNRNTGRSPYDTSHVDGAKKWKIYKFDEIIGEVEFTVVGENDTIYTGLNPTSALESAVFCAVDNNGTVKWTKKIGNMIDNPPAIASDGTIYAPINRWVQYEDSKSSYYGVGDLYALEPDGTIKWNFSTTESIYSSPAVNEEGTIYFGSSDTKLYALNPNGTVRWRYKTDDRITTSPAIGSDGTIYIGSDDGNLYAVNPDGTLKWKFGTGGKVRSSPAVSDDGTIYFGSNDGHLYAINPDGSMKWSLYTGSYGWGTSPSIAEDGTVYVGTNEGVLYAVYPNRTVRWKYEFEDGIEGSPVIGDDGTVYVGTVVKLYAISEDGKKKWSFGTGEFIESSPVIGKDGTLYIGTDSLYALGEARDRKNTYPIIYGGIFVILGLGSGYWFYKDRKKKN